MHMHTRVEDCKHCQWRQTCSLTHTFRHIDAKFEREIVQRVRAMESQNRHHETNQARHPERKIPGKILAGQNSPADQDGRHDLDVVAPACHFTAADG